MHNQYQKQSGVVLVLALLIVSVVLATAGALSNLVIRSIQQTRLIDQSMQAYYSAESGAERALYQIRRREAIPDCAAISGGACQSNGICSINSVPCITPNNGSLSLANGWTTNATNELSTTVTLKPGGSFQLDLFNPYQASSAGINQVVVVSDITPTSFYAEFTNITKILNVDLNNCSNSSQPPVFKGFIETPAAIGSLDGKSILDECSYSFRLNYPLTSSGDRQVTITVFNQGTDTQYAIPSRLSVSASAKFGRSQQSLTLKTPVRPPVSGLYDFVLFSEEAVVK